MIVLPSLAGTSFHHHVSTRAAAEGSSVGAAIGNAGLGHWIAAC